MSASEDQFAVRPLFGQFLFIFDFKIWTISIDRCS